MIDETKKLLDSAVEADVHAEDIASTCAKHLHTVSPEATPGCMSPSALHGGHEGGRLASAFSPSSNAVFTSSTPASKPARTIPALSSGVSRARPARSLPGGVLSASMPTRHAGRVCAVHDPMGTGHLERRAAALGPMHEVWERRARPCSIPSGPARTWALRRSRWDDVNPCRPAPCRARASQAPGRAK